MFKNLILKNHNAKDCETAMQSSLESVNYNSRK